MKKVHLAESIIDYIIIYLRADYLLFRQMPTNAKMPYHAPQPLCIII